ncbi:MAG TPA: DUF1176 domain-containing protein [Bordetella sp.]|nr:DUF1176 domain-containing protein [Bordetella sp.]
MYQAVLLALSTIVAAVPPGTLQSYDTYKSWLVACDNTLSCQAKGFTDGETRAELSIDREAGADGALTASLSAETTFAAGDVLVDGKPAGLDPKDWKRDDDGGTTLTTDRADAVRALVARLRNGTRLSLGGKAEVPLEGFAAAMLRVDDRQGRVGGVTALNKPGSAPAWRVPAALLVPHIPAHPISATLAAGEAERLIHAVRDGQQAVMEKEECESHTGPLTPEAYALDDKRALVMIPCLMGAYQGSSLAFVAPRGGGPVWRVIAPAPYLGNDPDRTDVDMFTEADFDPATGMLSMAGKGRGLADCGMAASWIWNGDTFQLASLNLQEACGGVSAGDWPTLFRSEQ